MNELEGLFPKFAVWPPYIYKKCWHQWKIKFKSTKLNSGDKKIKCCLSANIYFFTCFPSLWIHAVKTSLKLLIKPSKTAWVNLGIPEICIGILVLHKFDCFKLSWTISLEKTGSSIYDSFDNICLVSNIVCNKNVWVRSLF